MDQESKNCVLLLVEDNPADADLVRALLESDRQKHYQFMHVTHLAQAMDRLRDEQIDVMLLDLRLPDTSGVETVKTVKLASRTVPIIVLTGSDEESVGLDCIDAGAQDFLRKDEMRPLILRKAIEFALSRQREADRRQADETMSAFRSMSSESSSTMITAMLAGTGPLREREPELFNEISLEYNGILRDYFDHVRGKLEKPRDAMESLVTRLGENGAGPRDLIDVHVRALDELVMLMDSDYGTYITVEGRLLALELMGILVEFYRVGTRRRGFDGGLS
ncbi:response regulator [bacterium]|nr:response regulator [bacterium]